MKRNSAWILTAIVVAVLASTLLWDFSMRAATHPGRGAEGQVATDDPAKENFDIRDRDSKEAVSQFERRLEKLSSTQKERNTNFRLTMKGAEMRKAEGVQRLRVTFSNLTNSPEIVEARGGGRKFLRPSSSLPRESIVRGFVNDHADLFGMSPRQVARLRKTAEYANPNGKLSWLKMEQRWNGMKVFSGEAVAAFTSNGELVRLVSELTAGPEEQELATTPQVSAAAAVVAAAASVDATLAESELVVKESSLDGRTVVFQPAGPFTDDIRLELQYFPLDAGLATLAWSMVLWQDSPVYYTLVDAETGDLLWRKNIAKYQTQPATYVVYDSDSPAPLSPTTALPGSGIQGAAVPRTSFTLISELPAFDNLGWMADGVNRTVGNNVIAGLDLVAPNGIDPEAWATGSPFRVFNFNYNPAPGIPPPGGSPALANHRFGEVVNVFFWANRYHDRLYELGFTEAAGNFQNNNFGRGGVSGDRVLAEVQDSRGMNNARFVPPPDGQPGRMELFIFTETEPNRSSGLDQNVILHELTHGTANRLHGNAAGLTAMMSNGMDEGWADFYALSLLSQPGDDPHGIYPMGGYLSFQRIPGFIDNYYYGGRRFPYATISTVGPNGRPHNPLTFADIDPTQINLTDGAFPRKPFGPTNATEVHNVGEVWCAALWEARARIIDRMGFAGNQRMLQLVTDGMMLDPVNPTMLEGRDSILAADCAAFGGEDELDIWAGFAARGMGYSARAVSANSSSVVEAFDMPNLDLGAVTISDESSASPNGFADPGESLTLNIPLSNPFCATSANDVRASVNGGGSISYGDIPAGETVSRGVPFSIPSSTICGSQLPVTVTISSSLGTVTRTFNLQVGRAVGTVAANYSSGDIAVRIPSGRMVDIPINVADVGPVVDVNVRVRLTHNLDADLLLRLIGPDGTSVLLAANRGGNGQNFGAGANGCSGVPTVFDDSASMAIGAGTAPFAGSFRPDSPLSVFNGKPLNGAWVLRVADTGVFNVGTVSCVTLQINRRLFACNFRP
jgi:subtilisin-like proprotein convertase family protein